MSTTVASYPTHKITSRLAFRDMAIVPTVLLGAWLRLRYVDSSQFLLDPAGIYTLAVNGLTRHVIPATGIVASIQSFCQPVSIYLYMVPALLRDPAYGAYATAFANTAALIFSYWLFRHYLGYLPALIGTVLFAVSTWAVMYSRTIWQQNLLPPVVLIFVFMVLRGAVDRKRGWIALALPIWIVLVELHPATAPLAILIVLAWVLEPSTIRVRDLLLGGISSLVLLVPTIVWEVSSGWFDVRVYRQYASGPSVIDGSALQEFLTISGIGTQFTTQHPRVYLAIRDFGWVLIAAGLLYLLVRVVLTFLTALKWRDKNLRLGQQFLHVSGWLRYMAGNRPRVELILLVWPSIIVLAQIRHNAPIQPHYMIGTYPAQYMAIGLMLTDAWHVIWRLRSRFSALPGIAIVSCCIAGISLCGVQVAGSLALYQPHDPSSLTSEKAGLQAIRALALRDHVSLVEFVPDFFSVQSVAYMLENGYGLNAPTQILESGSCLLGTSGQQGTILYVTSGPLSLTDQLLTQSLHAHDVLAGTGGFFRGYLISNQQLRTLFNQAVTMVGARSDGVTFGNELALNSVLYGPESKGVRSLIVEGIVRAAPRAAPFHQAYVVGVSLSSSSGQQTSVSITCNVSHWLTRQRFYVFLPQTAVPAAATRPILTLSATRLSYTAPQTRLGPITFNTAYDLATVHYYVHANAVIPLRAEGCTGGVHCDATGTASIVIGSAA